MVEEYYLARDTEEMAQEARTLAGRGELEIEKENGIRLITFKDWLKGIRRDGEDGEVRSDRDSLPSSQHSQADSAAVGGSPHSTSWDGW